MNIKHIFVGVGIAAAIGLLIYLAIDPNPCKKYRHDMNKRINAEIISVQQHRGYHVELSCDTVRETVYGLTDELGKIAQPGDSLFKASGTLMGVLKKPEQEGIPVQVFIKSRQQRECE